MTLYSFSDDGDGVGPYAGLIQSGDGNFYGTTSSSQGGSNGTIFQLTAAGVLTTLHAFTGGSDGAQPDGALIEGSDGNFYGTAAYGGSNGAGTIFQITPAGVLTTLHTFTGGSDGGRPEAGLIEGSDGNFYGTTNGGGAYGYDPSNSGSGYGTVFQLTSAGVLTSLHSFTGGSDGNFPAAGLIQGKDGNFYGATVGDNVRNNGSIFEITPAGVLTVLYSFARGSANFGPEASLVQGSDGNFYGTSPGVDSSPMGIVFQITPAGVLTTLHSFTGASDGDGALPMGGLIQGRDGNFYGTTVQGGTVGENGGPGGGTIFEITPAGLLTILHRFDDGNDYGPSAGLIQGRDGNFYGTAPYGGVNADGAIFELRLGAAHPAFFTGEASLGNGVYYLSFPNGNYFGYYSYLADPAYLFHFDLGYEYVFDAADGNSGIYLYDFASNDFFYTSPGFPFPYLYDFGLQSTVYYYPDPNNVGHYNTDGVRYFYVFSTGQIISK